MHEPVYRWNHTRSPATVSTLPRSGFVHFKGGTSSGANTSGFWKSSRASLKGKGLGICSLDGSRRVFCRTRSGQAGQFAPNTVSKVFTLYLSGSRESSTASKLPCFVMSCGKECEGLYEILRASGSLVGDRTSDCAVCYTIAAPATP